MFYNDNKIMSEGGYKAIKNGYEKALADSTQELLEIANKMREQRAQIIENHLQSEYSELLDTLNRSIENLEGIISIRSREANSVNSTRKLSNHLFGKAMPQQINHTHSIYNAKVENDTVNDTINKDNNYNNGSNDNINSNINNNGSSQNGESKNANNEDIHNDTSNVDNPDNGNIPNGEDQSDNSSSNESQLDNTNNNRSQPNLTSGDSNENSDNGTQPNPVNDNNSNGSNNNNNDAIPPTRGNIAMQRQKRGYPIQMGNFSGILAKLLNPRRGVNTTKATTANTNKGYTSVKNSESEKTATFSQISNHQKAQTRMAQDSQSSMCHTSHYIHSHIAGNPKSWEQDNKKEPFVGSKLHTHSHKMSRMSSQNLYESIEPWGYPPFVDMPNLPPQGNGCQPPIPDIPCDNTDNMPDCPKPQWDTAPSNPTDTNCIVPKCPPLEPLNPCKPNHGTLPCPPCNDNPCRPYPPKSTFPPHRPRPKPSPCDPNDMILYHECDIISLLLLYMALRPNNPHSHRICTLAESHFNILRNLITKENK